MLRIEAALHPRLPDFASSEIRLSPSRQTQKSKETTGFTSPIEGSEPAKNASTPPLD